MFETIPFPERIPDCPAPATGFTTGEIAAPSIQTLSAMETFTVGIKLKISIEKFCTIPALSVTVTV